VTYRFRADLYQWDQRTEPFVLASIPEDIADEIEAAAPEPRRGFGAVKVEVIVGGTTWRTSLFPSKQEATFILPVKRAVLKAEGLAVGDSVAFALATV
jgi:hypothetical protein